MSGLKKSDFYLYTDNAPLRVHINGFPKVEKIYLAVPIYLDKYGNMNDELRGEISMLNVSSNNLIDATVIAAQK